MDASFEGASLRFYRFRGRPCVIAADLGCALGYGNGGKGLVDIMRREWREEMIEGQDLDVLTGAALHDLERDGEERSPSHRARRARLLVLYESGIDLVCVKTDKPLGRKLRRFLVTEVFLRLRRGEPILPGSATEPAPAALPDAGEGERAPARRLGAVPEDEDVFRPRRPRYVLPRDRRSMPLAAPAPAPLALPPPRPPLDPRLADALTLLGPGLDARVRFLLVTDESEPGPTARILRRAAVALETLRRVPGILPPAAPAERFSHLERLLDVIAAEVVDLEPLAGRVHYEYGAGILTGLTIAERHVMALPLQGLVDPEHVRRAGVAAERLAALALAFRQIVEPPTTPSPASDSGHEPAPVSGAGPGPRATRGHRPTGLLLFVA